MMEDSNIDVTYCASQHGADEQCGGEDAAYASAAVGEDGCGEFQNAEYRTEL